MKEKIANLLHISATQGGDDKMPTPYLSKRGKSWQFRFRVPENYREQIGKTEIVKSLGPVSHQKALQLWRRELARVYDLLVEAERVSSQRANLEQLTTEEIATVARRYFAFLENQAEAEGVPFDEALREQLVEVNDEELQGLSFIDPSGDAALQQIAKSAAQYSGVSIVEPCGNFHQFCEAIYAALIEHHHRQSDRLEAVQPVVRDTRFSPEIVERSLVQGPRLDEVIERWSADRPRRQKTLLAMRQVVSLFIKQNGDLSIDMITTAHVQNFKQGLLASGNAVATSANKFGLFKALVKFAFDNQIIIQDPCTGINIKPDVRTRTRRAYDTEELNALFSSPVFTEDERPRGGCGEAAYWLPLLALYTGARQREIGQLRPCDIVEETYLDGDGNEKSAWVIRIVDDPDAGLHLKNRSSERRIPVHPALIENGFVSFVDNARKNNQDRIFPELSNDRFGNPVASWSKWYGRYLRDKCNLTDRRLVFHSFRHSFKHWSRFSNIAPDVQNEITGHSTGDVASSYGGLEYPLHPLVEAMRKFRIPDFKPPDPPPNFR